jgi:rhamnose utilization protein RhaD (predicted bifunctional aldolase and dehydrogenase)/NAD(P)-dependent dehydrogenase (short-subunit alcohol dehydrogenase family)
MQNRWSDQAASEFAARYAPAHGEDLALRTYTSRLIGSEPGLVLHGGGNTSVKSTWTNVLGERIEALFIKASGHDLATIEPEEHIAIGLQSLQRLRTLSSLPDDAMLNELRTRQLRPFNGNPSIETLVHALVPGRFVDHTHADAILALTNQLEGAAHVRRALGEDVLVLPYTLPGFDLAKLVADACETNPRARAMVWMQHGIITWGETARASYELMIELVSRAEDYAKRESRYPLRCRSSNSVETALQRLPRFAPIVRGLLAVKTGNPDRPYDRVVLQSLVNREALDIIGSERGREIAVSAPLTPDHVIRTGVFPLWVNGPDYEDEQRFRAQVEEALRQYTSDYNQYLARCASRMPPGTKPNSWLPRVVLLPGLGVLCAGHDGRAARVARDITARTLAAKASIAAMGGRYRGLEDEHLFDMEYRPLQQAKINRHNRAALSGTVALVTGAAGAIGSAICERLLEHGAHVAVTDLPEPRLDELVGDLSSRFPYQVMRIPLDVTIEESLAAAFDAVSSEWGGLDVLVINAGLAHVSSLEEMDVEAFHRLQRVNTDGTLLLLRAASRNFKRQRTGGDIVLVSTKNVFAPGARFGAYSATKAAAHQLARIASLELAEHDVRVNMVAPDAVFSHRGRRSGLWAEVGPDRMRARGLDPDQLEEYYRSRNLLKARVTADHVANAVLFFVTRQTPTTGATLPVDGGLPEATPR